MKRRGLLPWLGAAGAVVALAACSVLSPVKMPPCPPVLVLKDANQLVRFKPGPGRDVTDVVFEAGIADFLALCKYNRKRTEVDIELNVEFDVRRGPGNTTRQVAFDYFAAIPHFHPAPQGKRVFHTEVAFKGNQSRLRQRERLYLTIPVDPKNSRKVYSTYIGFQLTPEEIEDNRRRAAR